MLWCPCSLLFGCSAFEVFKGGNLSQTSVQYKEECFNRGSKIEKIVLSSIDFFVPRGIRQMLGNCLLGLLHWVSGKNSNVPHESHPLNLLIYY